MADCIASPAPATPIHSGHSVSVYHADWRALLDMVPTCDAVIVDAPYSAKTHRCHDTSATVIGSGNDGAARQALNYAAWDVADVSAFVGGWSARCTGWMVSITDDVLAPIWAAAFESQGRYVFAPVPFVAPGSRVRMTGDGPSSWCCWIVVARPRSKKFATWGTLPGAYVMPSGMGGRMPVVGGKPPWLMHRLAEDYAREGGLVVDPCCGAGTTLIGALRAQRRAIGGDTNLAHAQLAAEWVIRPHGSAPGAQNADPGQLNLLGSGAARQLP